MYSSMNKETGLNEGDKTVADLMTIGLLETEVTGPLDKLFEEIRVAVVRCKYLVPIHDRSSAAHDSDDDSSDPDEDEFQRRSLDVRLPKKLNAEIVTVSTRYYFRGVIDYPDGQKTDENSHLWSAFDERMNKSFSSESQSEELWSLDLEQPWPSDRELPSDLESNSASGPSSKLKSASNSEVGGSINDEKLWPSSIMHAWWPSDSELWSASHSELKWSTDDEELFPTNLNQMWPSDSELKCATDDKQLQPSNSNQIRLSKSEHCSKSNSELKCGTDDIPLQLSTVKRTWLTDSALKLELHSELMWSTSKGQLDKTDLNQMWMTDSDLRVASYSDLGSTGSMDTYELGLSDFKQKCPTVSEVRSVSLSEPLMSSDDEQIVSFYEEQMVSLHDEEGINVVSTNEASEDMTVAEPPIPKRRSFLSALGRRVLSAGRKLFCCCVCGRNRKR